ncbi:hypothetical protein ACFC18_43095 [Streptomyces sp. NPDC056121]|uniref:hypothetical protein n=1 Tax=unclassified Streptomyces TaxID=2593676 RepID=UPI0035D79140
MQDPDCRVCEQVRLTGAGLADNPGAFLGTKEAQAEGELDGVDVAKVNRALVELGYVVVAEELLESYYDGPSRLPSHVQRPTWWTRFFGFF